jgi:hypothetical protein
MNRPFCLPASAPLALVALSLAASITGCGGDGPSDPCAGLLPGDLVISEVMANPSGADDGREWVEIHNPGSAELSLAGLELVRSAEDGSGARAHVLDTADLLAAGAYYVLGGVLDAARPSYVNYGYGDALGDFGNTSGRVVLRCGDRVIDEVVYLDSTDGASRAYDGDLPPNATANDDTTRWCDSPATFSTGDFGSPGVRNASCGGSSLGRCSEGGVERDTIPPTEGDVVITELHPNPMAVADGEGEWFEVLVQAEVDLNGLQLGKVPGTVLTTLSSSECLSVSPGTYVLFASSDDSATNGGMANVDFVVDLPLGNSRTAVCSSDTPTWCWTRSRTPARVTGRPRSWTRATSALRRTTTSRSGAAAPRPMVTATEARPVVPTCSACSRCPRACATPAAGRSGRSCRPYWATW